MLIVGLTGGIASGKSTVSAGFAARGAEIIDTDRLAREAVHPGSEGLAGIVAHFGNATLTPGGQLDRAQLRRRVFADPAELARLNSIVHPLVRALAIERLEQREGPYTILVVPLLLESGMVDLVDQILVVDVPVMLQRQRLLARGDVAGEEIDLILAAQASRAARLTAAHDIIDNSGSLASLDAAIDRLHARYLHRAQYSTEC
ncbi:MAG: dephospho-CoA kinase [Nitrococcus sp.]|nr:dephospho-CoA kinase [Nitrococcus sp.]